jgi:hypothetical protein
VFERFSEFALAGQAFERAQVFNGSVGHHMREEMHRVGQSFRWRLEPHHALSHGQQFRCCRQRFHGFSPRGA